MRVAPRDASASSPSDAAPAGRRWRRAQRLLRTSEYDSLAASGTDWRSARRWLALGVRYDDSPGLTESVAPVVAPGELAPLRFGLVVSKRQARRAVARNMVKRVLREAARHAAGRLEAALGSQRAEALFRLKAPLPPPAACNWAELKRQLRAEADGLLAQFEAQLRQPTRQERQERRAGGLAQSADAARAPAKKAAPRGGAAA